MTRRDFILISAALARSRPDMSDHDAYDAWCAVRLEIAAAIKAKTPTFDMDRFLLATDADAVPDEHPSSLDAFPALTDAQRATVEWIVLTRHGEPIPQAQPVYDVRTRQPLTPAGAAR